MNSPHRIAEAEFPLTPEHEGAIIPANGRLELVFVTQTPFRPYGLYYPRGRVSSGSIILTSFRQANTENFIGDVPLLAVVGQRLDLMTIVPKTINRLTLRNALSAPVIVYLLLRGYVEEGRRLFTKLHYNFENEGSTVKLTVMEDGE